MQPVVETRGRTFPFSGVDAVMRVLDEPRRPQTIQLEVAVGERLDEHRLREAVARAADRHPMARARQLPAGPFDLNDRWEIIDGLYPDPVEVCASAGPAELDAVRDAFYSRHIDVAAGAPFRVLLVHEEHGGDRVMLSVSHVAFDGVGSLRLLQSVSRLYAGQDDPLPDVDPIELRSVVEGQSRRRSRARGSDISAGFGARPARLASCPGEAALGFGILHLDLDDAEVTSRGEGTVNDVLLAALHLTIEQWNQSRGVRCERVMVMMPVNQRPPAWRGEVLANLVLSARVESSPAERSRPATLLAAVAAQTTKIKTDGVGGTPDPIPQRTPVALRRLLPHLIDAASGRTADTAVLSNLGRVEDPPWFGVEGRGLWFSPPPRRPVILTMGAGTAHGRVGISLRWCKGAFSAAAAREFADMLLTSLAVLRSAPPTQTD